MVVKSTAGRVTIIISSLVDDVLITARMAALPPELAAVVRSQFFVEFELLTAQF